MLRYLKIRSPCIIGLILASLFIVCLLHHNLTTELSVRNSVAIIPNKSLESTSLLSSPRELLLLYEQEYSRVESTSFRPTFHNHHLTLKLNLTAIAIEYFDYFKNSSTKTTSALKITCLQSSKNRNNFRSICDIFLTFQIKILNSQKVQLTLLSKNTSCSVLLTNISDLILINVHQTFSIDDIFRFTHQWTNTNNKTELFWRSWPPTTTTCLKSLPCSLTNILTHSTSKELFLTEQNAVSYWLDLQYQVFINQRLSNERKKSVNNRNFVPYEIAKNPRVCSSEFQNWILDYQKWHENIMLNINNGSMTFEEQRNRIIELDVRFLIYEKHTSGLSDRIIHLISTYLVALLTKRLFIFDKNWPEFTEIMQSSLNYDQQLIIPWIEQLDLLNKNLTQNDRKYLTSKTEWFSSNRLLKDYDYDKLFPERILTFKGHTGGVIQTIHSNSSIYRKFLTIDLQMNTNNIFGCLYHSLFTYKLSELINRAPLTSSDLPVGHSSQLILQILLAPIFFPIGVQVRAGDETMNEQNIDQSNPEHIIGKYQNFLACIQQINMINEKLVDKTIRTPIVFLLSDSYEIRRAALKLKPLSLECYRLSEKECQLNYYDLHVLASPNPVFHVSNDTNRVLAFKLGMFDIFLFSLCEQHLISTESSFGRFPAFASLKQRNIYSLGLHELKSCKNDGLPLSAVGYQWSGI
ncbi:unnamed protein product [Adineta steineri]|uniref:Uncharacterized protein n=1 Tax=Adineta steineri TaxID=433720 RepID=A0A814GF46_9BILA|nr:unnamed protein product [Adineta steineri]CAF1065329.1 unnamed protein product [Adineta steineri]